MAKDFNKSQQQRRERPNSSGAAAFADLEKYMRSTPAPFSAMTPKLFIDATPTVKSASASAKTSLPVGLHQVPLTERFDNRENQQPQDTVQTSQGIGYRVPGGGSQRVPLRNVNGNGLSAHRVTSPLAAPQAVHAETCDINHLRLELMGDHSDCGCEGNDSHSTDSGTEVGLTMPVYEALTNQMGNLESELVRLAKEKISQFLSVSSAVLASIEKDLVSKDDMDKVLAERDETIRRLQMEMAKGLRAVSKPTVEEKPGLRNIIEARDHEIDELKDELDQLLRINQEITNASSNHDELVRELARDVTAKDMKLLTMAKGLETEKNQVRALTDQVAALKPRNDGRTLESLEKELKEKTTENMRYRIDATECHKKLQYMEATCRRLADNTTALRGSVLLVQPASTTKFPRTVLACKECWIKNLACDNGAKCQGCIDNGTKCLRWRCAMTHLLKHCPDQPFCTLGHSTYGWLESQQERPVW
ncbi:hypothetical protein K491DRAFT_715540 [Lophiostoma macrostomum CBS 122681]|uniref:Uncharacterized protein n=1 Tax=Lophiostoma macrostomum CBS 122681 TaxID=1314788 RepID=A0A6A6T8Q5_9PLEO|nr:hypothetical protein K491DRAFT_715540 [Lophiostoma macrostomum CBS 122681]